MDGWITIGTKIDTTKFDKQVSELESKITKQATEKITSTKDSVKYKIEYNAEVENYIGEALVTIVTHSSKEISISSYAELKSISTWSVPLSSLDK